MIFGVLVSAVQTGTVGAGRGFMPPAVCHMGSNVNKTHLTFNGCRVFVAAD